MSHANAPLTPAGRLRLVQRCAHRPISHVAAEAGVARQTLTKWLRRYEAFGEAGLVGRSSAPHSSPTRTPSAVVERIEDLRRTHKWTARQIHLELTRDGHTIAPVTVARWLRRLGISRRRDIDPAGATNRTTAPILARYPGHMIHLDVKKVGRIPAGGGWRAHGRGSAQAKAAGRPGQDRRGSGRVRLPTFGRGRVLASGLRRNPVQRNRGYHYRVLGPGQGVLRRSRHHPNHPGRDRQRGQLPCPQSFVGSRELKRPRFDAAPMRVETAR